MAYPKEVKEEALALFMTGHGLYETARRVKVTPMTVHLWVKAAEKDGQLAKRVEQKEDFIARGWEVLMNGLCAIDAKITGASMKELTWMLGILYDKLAHASGEPTSRHEISVKQAKKEVKERVLRMVEFERRGAIGEGKGFEEFKSRELTVIEEKSEPNTR